MPQRVRQCCSSLLQAVVCWFTLLLIILYFRTFAEGRVSERLIQIGQNAVGVMIGLQSAIVCFRWRVLNEQDEPN